METNREVRGPQTVRHSAVRMSTQDLPIKYTFSLFTETFLTTPSFYKDYGSLIISPSLLESPWKGRPQASAGVGETEGWTGMGRWDSPQCGCFGAAQPAGDDLQLCQVRRRTLLEIPEGVWEPWPGASAARQEFAKRDQQRGLRCHVLGTQQCGPGTTARFLCVTSWGVSVHAVSGV